VEDAARVVEHLLAQLMAETGLDRPRAEAFVYGVLCSPHPRRCTVVGAVDEAVREAIKDSRSRHRLRLVSDG